MEIEANLKPHSDAKQYMKVIPWLNISLATGEVELETYRDGSQEFKCQFNNLKFTPGSVFELLINEQKIMDLTSQDGTSVYLKNFSSKGEYIPAVEIGDTARITCQELTVFTGTFKRD